MTVMQRFRFWLIHLFRLNNEKRCWADLVTFAVEGDLLEAIKEEGDYCKAESITHPHKQCWCGKFQNGKHT